MSGAGGLEPPPPGGQVRAVLALDTATARAVLALGRIDGTMMACDSWDPGRRHAEEILVRIERLLGAAGIGRSLRGTLAGIVVGTGPGGFTGLRVGLATARGLARAAAVPLVGIPTGAALEAAARAAGQVPPGAPAAVLLPAGPTGRYLARDGAASLAPPWEEGEDLAPGAVLVAVDLAGRAGSEAVRRGVAAREGLAAALLALGCERLRSGAADHARAEPEYVTLPRGMPAAVGEAAWSPARR